MIESTLRARGLLIGLTWACLLTVLVLAGCGASSSAGSVGSAPSARATATSGHGGLAVKPCPGNATTIQGSPDVVLTEKQEGSTSQVNVGGTIVVKLPMTFRWTLAQGGSGPVLQGVDPQGGIVSEGAESFCVWAFQVVGAGETTLAFNGAPLCDPTQPCPQLERAVKFTVSAQ